MASPMLHLLTPDLQNNLPRDNDIILSMTNALLSLLKGSIAYPLLFDNTKFILVTQGQISANKIVPLPPTFKGDFKLVMKFTTIKKHNKN